MPWAAKTPVRSALSHRRYFVPRIALRAELVNLRQPVTAAPRWRRRPVGTRVPIDYQEDRTMKTPSRAARPSTVAQLLVLTLPGSSQTFADRRRSVAFAPEYRTKRLRIIRPVLSRREGRSRRTAAGEIDHSGSRLIRPQSCGPKVIRLNASVCISASSLPKACTRQCSLR
jgi:hypothetical protein